jgi:hypothetical protein
VKNNKALHKYFNVVDIRDVRTSPRYVAEVAPKFKPDPVPVLSLDSDCNLVVVGTWVGRDAPGVYTLATHGPDAGKYVRAAMTF